MRDPATAVPRLAGVAWRPGPRPPMTLRAALLTPFAPPSVRGNAITVDRIAQGLTERGLDVRVWDLSVTPEAAVEAGGGAYRPALIHAFHAFRVETGRASWR